MCIVLVTKIRRRIDTEDTGREEYTVGIQSARGAEQTHHHNGTQAFFYVKRKCKVVPTLHSIPLGNVKDTKATENMTLLKTNKQKNYLLFGGNSYFC